MKHKKNVKRNIAAFTLACAIAFSGGVAYAANNTLPSGFVIADADGIHASKDDGGYMLVAGDIGPGDVITKTVTLRNLESGSSVYGLYMTAEPVEVTGTVDLVKHSNMVMRLDDTVIYTGPVDGITGGLLRYKSVPLGKYNSGDMRVLHIIITIDEDWKLEYTQSKATFRWIFYASKDENPDEPKTGEIITYILYILCILMLTVLCVLFFVYKKRNKKGCGR